MDKVLVKLHQNVKDAEKALQDYINSKTYDVLPSYEEFSKMMDVYPVSGSISSTAHEKVKLMTGKDFWDLGYYKYETIYYKDLCERIADYDEEEEIECLKKYFNVDDEQVAIDKAIEEIMKLALEKKSSGFELDW